MTFKAILITILLSLACGLAANLGTPLIKSFYLKGVFNIKRTRIGVIKQNLETIEFYRSNPNALNLFVFKELFRVIFWVLLGTLILLVSAVTPSAPYNLNKWVFRLGAMVLAATMGATASNITTVKSVFYSKRKKQLLEKLAKLEGKLTQNP